MIKIFLFLGLCWMLGLWTKTSPQPASYYLQNIFLPKRLLTSAVVLLLFFQLMLPAPALSAWTIVGACLFTSGIIFASWAKFVMRQNWGEPAQHNIKKQKHLVIEGPFSFSRNPIYVGLLMIVLGFEITIGSVLVIIIIPLAFLVHRAVLQEESLLKKHFGKTYTDYQRLVRRYV